MLNKLLDLQTLDLEIESFLAREHEIPKQKDKIEVYRKRLTLELDERQKRFRELTLEQRQCETDIEQMQTQINKYSQQLFAIKKNEEYQALLHEMDMLKKQVGLKEERILSLMMEMDEGKARLEEDKKRIESELKELDKQCRTIDEELAQAVAQRRQIENRRGPAAADVKPDLLARYNLIRERKKSGPALVPLYGESCSGCHMHVRPQIVNELMAGERIHACAHCGRLLYHTDNIKNAK